MNKNENTIHKISKEFYEISIGKTRTVKKYDSKQMEYIIKFKNIHSDMIESLKLVEKLFKTIIDDIKLYTKPDDSVKIYIDHPNFDGGDIQTRFHKGRDLDANVIIQTISRLAQSGKILSLNDKLKFNVLIINYKSGGGLKRVSEYLLKKQCVVRIRSSNDDQLCGLRAICVGKAFIDNTGQDNS